MTVGTAFSKRLDDYLVERKISLYALAKKAGVPLATLQNFYRGRTKSPTLSVVLKICGALGVSVDEFLSAPYFDPSVLELDG